MSSSPRTLAEAWKLQQGRPRCSSFGEGTSKVRDNTVVKSPSVGTNLDRLTNISHLLSSLDSINLNRFDTSFSNLDHLK